MVEYGDYNTYGYRLINFAEERNIPLCTDLEQETGEAFGDWIHLTAEGQHVINDVLYPQIVKAVVSK